MLNDISLKILGYEEKLLLYAKMELDYLNMEAVFSDETENFVSVGSDGNTIIKIRTAKNNVERIRIFLNELETILIKTSHDALFDYFAGSFTLNQDMYKYYFAIDKGGRTYFYNKNGITRDLNTHYNFTVLPNFKTPEWAKGAIMYHIFVDRFCNGDRSNDVLNNEYTYLGKAAKKIDNWYKELETEDICNFYGGDLKGIMDKIPYLKELGVDVLFLNPIFVSPSNHKYDAQDYDYVDPHLGEIVEDAGEPLFFGKFRNKYATKYIQRTTNIKNLEASNNLFEKFVRVAHENGMKVILDGVFNHCGAFNKWLDREGFYANNGYPPGAYREKYSPYNSYFKWYADEWPNNDCYDSWWGHDNHPKLNFEGSGELYNYMLDIGKKWVSPPYNADGWRLDVAADLGYSPEFNHKFWRDFRTAVKDANPDAIILAENYGDSEPWLQGDQWDTVMNYDAFMEPITWFLTGMEKHSEEFRGDMLCNAAAFEGAMRYHMSRFSIQSLQISMNELSNHDHSRFLTRTNMTIGRLHSNGKEAADSGLNKAIMYEAIIFQMTWPGAPTVYYGDEAGVCGWTDPDNRRTYPWGKEDAVMLELHKKAIAIHKKYSCFSVGSLEYLFMDYGVISYGRWDEDSRGIVILNNNNHDRSVSIPVWKINIQPNADIKRVLLTSGEGIDDTQVVYSAKNGKVSVTMPPFSSMTFVAGGRTKKKNNANYRMFS